MAIHIELHPCVSQEAKHVLLFLGSFIQLFSLGVTKAAVFEFGCILSPPTLSLVVVSSARQWEDSGSIPMTASTQAR